MPRKVKNDLLGKRFGKLVAIAFVPDDTRYSKYIFRCDCGNEKLILAQSVVRKFTTSCGCYGAERRRIAGTKHGACANGSKTATYKSWCSMMDRCHWGGHKEMFAHYGAKGIVVCPEWHSYERFLADMGPRPVNKTIDRINGKLGYSKDNCRWATALEQARNTSRNLHFLSDGAILSLTDVCNRFQINRGMISARVFRRKTNYPTEFAKLGIAVSRV